MAKETIKPKLANRKHCPHCGEDNFSFAKYCSGCGREMPERLFTTQDIEKPKPEPKATKLKPIINTFTEPKDKTASSIKKLGNRLVLIALFALLIFTNPNEEKHIENVKNKLYKDSKSNPDLGGAEVALLEIFIGKDVTNMLMQLLIERQNYLLFSVTVVTLEQGPKVVAIGVLGTFIHIEDIETLLTKAQKFINNE